MPGVTSAAGFASALTRPSGELVSLPDRGRILRVMESYSCIWGLSSPRHYILYSFFRCAAPRLSCWFFRVLPENHRSSAGFCPGFHRVT